MTTPNNRPRGHNTRMIIPKNPPTQFPPLPTKHPLGLAALVPLSLRTPLPAHAVAQTPVTTSLLSNFELTLRSCSIPRKPIHLKTTTNLNDGAPQEHFRSWRTTTQFASALIVSRSSISSGAGVLMNNHLSLRTKKCLSLRIIKTSIRCPW